MVLHRPRGPDSTWSTRTVEDRSDEDACRLGMVPSVTWKVPRAQMQKIRDDEGGLIQRLNRVDDGDKRPER